MNELSLFSGVGGGLLASKYFLGWKTIGYVEINEYCQKVIAQRIKDGMLDEAPIFGDIRAFINDGYAESYKGMVDVVSGGFPCQPFSTASHQRKTAKNLWPEMQRAIETIEPAFVFAENVQKSSIDEAAKDLYRLGYFSKAVSLSAANMGADHVRRRFWLFAYSNDKKQSMRGFNDEMGVMQELQGRVWESFNRCERVVNGLAGRMEQFRAIGNGQVPQVAATAWRFLTGALF
jgi:DNA (cytosine-5)-methyltransferase 1